MQPKNKPENLTPPHKGPSYCPKEKETKVIIEVLKSEEETKVKWHPYPKERPPKDDDYLITIKGKHIKKVMKWNSVNGYFNIYVNVIAWAELPKPYKEEE